LFIHLFIYLEEEEEEEEELFIECMEKEFHGFKKDIGGPQTNFWLLQCY
jgi:hypothetical protein